jgi:hypothetical protein
VNAKKRQGGGVSWTEGLTVAVEGKFIGRLYAERLKCIAELRDRLFIWSRTAIAHWSGCDTIYWQKAGIGIDTQCEKQKN